MLVETCCRNLVAGERGTALAAHIVHADGDLFLLAGGGRGPDGGAAAAERLETWCQETLLDVPLSGDPLTWVQVLSDFDQALADGLQHGHTGALLVANVDGELSGAGVGLNHAMLYTDDELKRLSAAQLADPLLGSGEAMPAGFGPVPFSGTLLLVSAALFRYADHAAVWPSLFATELDDVAGRLADLMRDADGRLKDDLSVTLCRAPDPDALSAVAIDDGDIEEITISAPDDR